jgi:hypothetical protein
VFQRRNIGVSEEKYRCFGGEISVFQRRNIGVSEEKYRCFRGENGCKCLRIKGAPAL